MKLFSLLTASLLLGTSPAHALNIVLSNDDGLTSNVKALYEHLKSQGHDVIVSVPCHGQSGMGAAIIFSEPLTPLTADCHNGAAKAGDPGAGRMTRDGMGADFFYVRGTPVMALLYGLDVQAIARWGKVPDLVLSGPNEGQNVGSVVVGSGTVSNAQYGAIRDIPAIAFSAGVKTTDNIGLANPDSRKVASLAGQLVAHLADKAAGERLLPPGVALNVNFPDDLDSPKWRMARIGDYDTYTIGFAPGSPKITVARNANPPTAEQMDNEAVVYKSAIAISVMQVSYDHRPDMAHRIGKYLGGLMN
ncbi:5'/3'-nucleotidase SurE [Sphingomonas sp. KC8]|uniref:5'/3'-nucleotidase SurE n=1 Tax=Sphingomonas sp. KC8 TaxID=1030157 RepID=UPI000248AB96|nr:5'/3'-nucleotidase SurE [Sphingomonas sp. KC8]ARS26791.1 hypothetical protein KC8_05760 [Sphingomonas sp. KC8]